MKTTTEILERRLLKWKIIYWVFLITCLIFIIITILGCTEESPTENGIDELIGQVTFDWDTEEYVTPVLLNGELYRIEISGTLINEYHYGHPEYHEDVIINSDAFYSYCQTSIRTYTNGTVDTLITTEPFPAFLMNIDIVPYPVNYMDTHKYKFAFYGDDATHTIFCQLGNNGYGTIEIKIYRVN